jgi:hypothetical protein
MTGKRRKSSHWFAAVCCAISLSAAGGAPRHVGAKDPLEPARAALRTLQFNRAIELLAAAGKAGNPDAQYLLGLMYLNGVGTASDPGRAKPLLQSAAARSGHASRLGASLAGTLCPAGLRPRGRGSQEGAAAARPRVGGSLGSNAADSMGNGLCSQGRCDRTSPTWEVGRRRAR